MHCFNISRHLQSEHQKIKRYVDSQLAKRIMKQTERINEEREREKGGIPHTFDSLRIDILQDAISLEISSPVDPTKGRKIHQWKAVHKNEAEIIEFDNDKKIKGGKTRTTMDRGRTQRINIEHPNQRNL